MKERIKIPFVENKSVVPVVRFTLDSGATGCAVIDTGSESTVFDKDFVLQNKKSFRIEVTENKISLVGVMENNEAPIVYGTSSVEFAGQPGFKLDMQGMIIPLKNIESNLGFPPAAIIGSDILNKLGAKLNFKRKTMTLYNDLSGK